MHDVKLQLFAAALATFKKYMGEFGPAHIEAGISREKWDVLVQPDLWDPAEARDAANTLDDMISAGLQKAGLGAIQLPAEYMAKAIESFVHQHNWLSAANFGRMYFDGAKAVQEGTLEARETVKPDYMYLLISQAYNSNSAKRSGPQDAVDAQVVNTDEKAKAK